MRNFLFAFLLIAVGSAVLQMVLPWWIIALVAFGAGFLFRQNSFASFLAGFCAVFLVWTLYAFILSSTNDNVLAAKVAALLPMKGQVWALLLATGIVGGLVSGFASLSGNLAAQLKG
jgi:hypothetical protein